MAGKHADIRYEVLDRCFGSSKPYFIEDLIEECNKALWEEGKEGNISERTIRSDIAYLKRKFSERFELDENAFEGKRKIYRYKDTTFSINGLNQKELAKVKDTLAVLLKFRGLPQFTWINEIVTEIKARLKIDVDDNYREVIAFESNEDYEGLVHITDLFNAIINKQVLNIKYQPFSSPEPQQLEFHSYYLKQYSSRWFIIGHNPQFTKQKYQILALDRISKKGISIVKKKYEESDENWQDYFSDFVGVSKEDGKPVEIKLLIVDKEQANYIRTKPLHQTQKPIKEVKEGFETSIKVIPNYELYKLFLSFGERIKVLGPESVKAEMKRKIEGMKKLY